MRGSGGRKNIAGGKAGALSAMAGGAADAANAASAEAAANAVGDVERAADAVGDERIDLINRIFTLFRVNYHNQFCAAFPEDEHLNLAKKLWLETLADYPAEQVLRGARRAIESCEFLPTLNRMLECCQAALGECGLPEARAAYHEACQAGAPKAAQPWSHPAVYFAGRDCGWFFLSREPESRAYPVFQDHYRRQCRRVMQGEALTLPAPATLPPPEQPTSRKQALKELAAIQAGLRKS